MTHGSRYLSVAGMFVATALTAQVHAQGYGPGMMWGSGAGPNAPGVMMGNGPGYGPGPGPGPTGGYGGMGPGMMGGWGAGMGPGMMGGFGYAGMGPGMMAGWGYGGLAGLDLTDQQRSKIDQIQDDLRKKNWAVMGRLLDEQSRMRDLASADKPDPAAIGKQSMKMADLQRQMLEAGMDARNQIDAVLTKEQKAQWQKYRRSWWNYDGQ